MGVLLDKLQYQDELYTWIQTYAGFDANYMPEKPIVSLGYLMRFWDKNKQDLYHLLDNNIIYEKEIRYERSYDELFNKMRHFVDYEIGRTFCRAYADWVQQLKGDAFGDEDTWSIRHRLLTLINPNTLADNTYTGRSFKVKVGAKEISIPSGCKAIKALNKLANAAMLPDFETFRIGHSMILNDRKTTGTLCFSIHPLDYFTMSDNEYDWDSCMNWRNNGCYRMGTVEMCNSPYVVVCYLRGEKEMRFYDKVWNSKKWRNLFIVSKDIITGVKGYPYQSDFLDTECIKVLKHLAEKNFGFNYSDTIYEHEFNNEQEYFYLNEDDEETHTFSFETGIMYNDFGNCTTTHFVINPEVNSYYVYYSGEAECMCCGAIVGRNYEDDDAEKLFCGDCVSYNYCDDCGCRLAPDEVYELDGISLCESCYCEHRVFDVVSREYHYDGNCIQIFLIEDEDEDVSTQEYNEFLSEHKYVDVYIESDDFTDYHEANLVENNRYGFAWTTNVKYMYVSECSPVELKLFERFGAYS